ncbi:MAG: hypothetical protein ACT4PZ_19765 [Panacagrimonas sp.]
MDKTFIKEVIGERSVYEIYRVSSFLGGDEFFVYKDGKVWKMGYKTLPKALEAVREDQ